MADTANAHASIVDLELAKAGIKHTLEGAVGLALALVFAFPAKLLLFGLILLYLLGLGLILVVVRFLFMISLPTLIQFAVPLTALVDFLELVIVAFIDAAITVIDAIIAIADFFSGKPHNRMIHYPGFKLLTVSQVRDELRYILENCKHDTDAWGVVSRITLSASQKPVCSAMRYVYPSRWLYSASTWLAGWLYEGSAVPDASPIAVNRGENCATHVESGYLPPVCAALGSGYVIVEMIVPAYVLIILHSAVGITFWLFVWGALQLGWTAIKAGFSALDRVFFRYLT